MRIVFRVQRIINRVDYTLSPSKFFGVFFFEKKKYSQLSQIVMNFSIRRSMSEFFFVFEYETKIAGECHFNRSRFQFSQSRFTVCHKTRCFKRQTFTILFEVENYCVNFFVLIFQIFVFFNFKERKKQNQ